MEDLFKQVREMYPESLYIELQNGASMLFFGQDESCLIKEQGKVAIIKHSNTERFDLNSDEEAIKLIQDHQVPHLNNKHREEIRRDLHL